MISNDQLRKTIKDCEQAGYNIGLRDIAYVLLCNHFEENASAYKIVFGLDRDYNKDNAIPYDNTSAIQYLRTYVDTVLISRPKGKIDDDISFEENKSEIIKLIKKTQDAVAAGEIETKDADFNVDFHEAIAMVPGMGDDKKGKVIDCVQTGYTMNDKVIRHAKVAVGQ